MRRSADRWFEDRSVVIPLGSIAAAGLVALMLGLLVGSRAASSGSRPGWTTYTDAEHGFTVQFPSTWRRAESPLVSDRPGEILSLGTGPLKVGGGGNCGEYPVKAMRAMRSKDVLIVVKDWSVHSSASSVRHAPERPFPFQLRYQGSPPQSALAMNEGAPAELTRRLGWREFEFRDHGRVFRVLLVIGKSAPGMARRAALRSLDSLRFRPASG